jgi:hypothetical protein
VEVIIWSILFLWGIVWLTCIRSVGALRMFGDVVTWTTILGGCVMHGCGTKVFKHFKKKYEACVQSHDITFISHSNL